MVAMAILHITSTLECITFIRDNNQSLRCLFMVLNIVLKSTDREENIDNQMNIMMKLHLKTMVKI